jgi:hypothetical protein
MLISHTLPEKLLIVNVRVDMLPYLRHIDSLGLNIGGNRKMFRFLILVATIGLAGCASDATPSAKVVPPQFSSFRDVTPQERKLLASVFAKSLKDPESARWEWAPVRSDVADGSIEYCGNVNARNSFGGYIGSRTYISTLTIKNGTIINGRIELPSAPLEHTITCQDRGLPFPT